MSLQLPFLEDDLCVLNVSSEALENGGWHEQMLQALGVEGGSAWPDCFGRALRRWMSQRDYRAIRTLSLFSGGGGLDIAFRDAGFEIVEMVEIEERYAATLRANTGEGTELGQSRVRCVDIRNYQADDLEIDFIIGGPPCQTFSAAGRRASGVRGTSDLRGTLFEEYVRLLRQLRPRAFLFENVYGIIGAEGGGPWRAIQEAFKQAGYRLFWRVLDAADYGVPQHRERLFIIGLRDEIDVYLFPHPTHGPDAAPPRHFYTANEAVNGANECGGALSSLRGTSIGGRYEHLIADIPPGLNYSFYTSEMGHPSPVFAWRSKFSDFMYKADPNRPVRTIKAQGGLYTGPFSWENRHFTVAETKRLQTFPDGYTLVGNRGVCLEQIGNSVPPQLGRILALSLLHQVFRVSLPFPMHFIPHERVLGFRRRKRALTHEYAETARKALAKTNLVSTTAVAEKEPLELECVHEARYLTTRFELKREKVRAGQEVWLNYHVLPEDTFLVEAALEENHWKRNKNDTAYILEIQSAPQREWSLPWKKVRLVGATLSPIVYTALWKAWEEVIATHYNIADLVQLSGYYQYRPQIQIALKPQIDLSNASVVWRVLNHVVKNNGTAVTLRGEALAQLWGIESNELVPVLNELRILGYETRSHRTNPQITPGEYLIPYAFPTLTSRSIQGHKLL